MGRFDEAINDAVNALHDCGVPYALTGSFAAAHYGYVRATTDVDFKVEAVAFHRNAGCLDGAMRKRGYVALEDGATFEKGLIQVELYARRDALNDEAIANAVEIRDPRYPHGALRIVRIEHLILSKVREFRDFGDAKHVDDVRKLFAYAADAVDVARLRAGLRTHGLEAAFDDDFAV